MYRIDEIHVSDWDKIPSVQSGSGIVGYRGSTRYQRGNGIGSVLRSIFKTLKPIGTRALKSAAKEGLETASLIGSDLLEGQDLGSSIKSRGKNVARNLVRKTVNKYRRNVNPKLRGYKRLKQEGGRMIGYRKRKPAKKRKRRQIGYGEKKRKYKRKSVPRKATRKTRDIWSELYN